MHCEASFNFTPYPRLMDKSEPPKVVGVPIKWVDHPEIQTLTADEFFVQDLGDRLVMTIGQMRLPMADGVPELVEVHAISRLQISQDTLSKLVKLVAILAERPREPDSR